MSQKKHKPLTDLSESMTDQILIEEDQRILEAMEAEQRQPAERVSEATIQETLQAPYPPSDLVAVIPTPDECIFDHLHNCRELTDRQRQMIEIMGRDPDRAWTAADFNTIGMTGGYSGIGIALKCLFKRDLVEMVGYDRTPTTRLRPNYKLISSIRSFYKKQNAKKLKEQEIKDNARFEEKRQKLRKKLARAQNT